MRGTNRRVGGAKRDVRGTKKGVRGTKRGVRATERHVFVSYHGPVERWCCIKIHDLVWSV